MIGGENRPSSIMKHPVEGFLAEYMRATNTHRFDEVAPLVDENAVFWFSSGSFRGLAAIRAAFERTWAAIQNEVYTIVDVEWIMQDDANAVCLYTFHWRGDIDGTAREGSGRGTSVLRKTDGRWFIVHEHLSRWP